jgi:glycerophosphoryl diester phosphodiesterase
LTFSFTPPQDLAMRFFLTLAALAASTPVQAQLVIAHRGASGERPEHTLAAYERAIDAGADFIEPDLVVTKDLVLVARHENELSDTTDVASREEFADRRRSKEIDGQLVAGWFAEDFTLAELRSLRAKERLPALRPVNARYDGLYQVPTFAEIVALVRAKSAENGRIVGLYPELKHPTFLLQQGIDTVDLFVAFLRKEGLDGKAIPIFVQSFEVAPLQRLYRLTDLKLVQLVSANGGPIDESGLTYAEMLSPSGLARIATYADAVGAEASLVLDREGRSTGVVETARSAGLPVHAWTLRKENAFLPPALRRGSGEGGSGDYAAAWALLAATGVEGVFTDDPALAAPLKRSVRP